MNNMVKMTVQGYNTMSVSKDKAIVFSDIPGGNPEDVMDLLIAFMGNIFTAEICQTQTIGEGLQNTGRMMKTFGLKYEGGKISFICTAYVRQEDRKGHRTFVYMRDDSWQDIEKCPPEEIFSISIPDIKLPL